MKITIYELEIIESRVESRESRDEDPRPKTKDHALRVACSAGTYIRTLAEDIGKKIGVGAHLAELRRTGAGKFDLSNAVTIEELEAIVAAGKLDDYLISMNEAVAHLPPVVLSEKEIQDTRNGKRLQVENIGFADNQLVRMIDAAENLAAIGFYNQREKSVQPKLVLI